MSNYLVYSMITLRETNKIITEYERPSFRIKQDLMAKFPISYSLFLEYTDILKNISLTHPDYDFVFVVLNSESCKGVFYLLRHGCFTEHKNIQQVLRHLYPNEYQSGNAVFRQLCKSYLHGLFKLTL